MNLSAFIQVFDANIMEDDLQKDTEDGLLGRARNSVNVLAFSRNIPLLELRDFLESLLHEWPAMQGELERRSEVIWSNPPERKVLLHKLVCEAQRHVENLIARESPA